MEILVKVDGRGRVVIPAEVRRRLGVKKALRMKVEDRRIILEVLEDPIEKLAELVISAPSSEKVVEDEFERELEGELGKLVRKGTQNART